MKLRRALLYARVSTEDQSPDLQLDDLRRAAQARKWEIVDEFVDHGISGKEDSRPELDRMMAEVIQGNTEIVAVWRLDRLGRSLRHLVESVDLFGKHGVEFVSLRDPAFDTTSAAGRFNFSITAALAEFESGLIGERTKAGMKAAASRGSKMGRPKREVDLDAARALLERWGNMSRVAKALGVSRWTLVRRLKEERR